MDVTLIAALTSTSNTSHERDPALHLTKQDNKWHFGMKMYVGVDATLGLIHNIHKISANVHNIVASEYWSHGKEK